MWKNTRMKLEQLWLLKHLSLFTENDALGLKMMILCLNDIKSKKECMQPSKITIFT